MKVRWFEWEDTYTTAKAVRDWGYEAWPDVQDDVARIERTLIASENRDELLLSLTAQFDATDVDPESLRVDAAEATEALSRMDADLLRSLEIAADNVRVVAEAQLDTVPREVRLSQGQIVTIREVPVRAAGIYAPGGRAAYPSSVLMCAIPARVAGVERIALATPPGPDGKVNPVVLAAAALCEVDEVYAMGGAQAIFALAYGTETIDYVNAVAGPGNAWVREAKAKVSTIATIDSLAGPSELMVLLDATSDLRWAALDICAQAEHGAESPLVVVATERQVLEQAETEVKKIAASRSGVANAPLAFVEAPDLGDAIEFANRYAPEHLELLLEDYALLTERVDTAGCVFAGPYSATAFGDYVAGSNHVLPTSGAGRFSGPLGPGTFRRRIATVEVSAGAAAKLAPHVDALARAEGFPVHGESAMIRR